MRSVAVIGAGSIGSRHIGNLLSLGCDVGVLDARLDTQAAALTKHEGAHACTNPLNYDAVVIATPHQLHLDWAEHVIEAGVPLFVEKPLGSLGQLCRWRQLAQEARNLVTQVGYQCRFHPQLRALRDQWKDRATAGGFYCDVNMATWPGKSYGPWLLECSHDIDAALFCGAPPKVTAVDFPSSTSCEFWLGEHWLISIDAQEGNYYRSWRVSGDGSDACVNWHSPEALGTLMYYDEMLHFIECVREGRQTDCPLSDGVKVLEVCAQVERMAKRAA